MSYHPRLDFNLVEGFAVINSNHGSVHFWNDKHVAQVGLFNIGLHNIGLHNIGLLVGGALFLLLVQLLDQNH